jgi:hypothetical protein
MQVYDVRVYGDDCIVGSIIFVYCCTECLTNTGTVDYTEYKYSSI